MIRLRGTSRSHWTARSSWPPGMNPPTLETRTSFPRTSRLLTMTSSVIWVSRRRRGAAALVKRRALGMTSISIQPSPAIGEGTWLRPAPPLSLGRTGWTREMIGTTSGNLNPPSQPHWASPPVPCPLSSLLSLPPTGTMIGEQILYL